MDPVSISEAREQLASIVFLTRDGHQVAAVIDSDDLERLIEPAEDMSDIRAAADARAEMAATGEAPIPWPSVVASLPPGPRPVAFVQGSVPGVFFEPLPDDESEQWT